jgi:LonC protease-like protein
MLKLDLPRGVVHAAALIAEGVLMRTPYELDPEQLRRTIDPRALGIQTTAEVAPCAGIIGQRRAVAALQFGLGIRDNGFNIYVAGPPRSGKMTAVQSFIEELARAKPTPPDWCYVNNFADPYQPNALRLPAGRGRRLQQDMKSLIEHLRRELPRAFESDDYSAHRDELLKDLNQRRGELLDHFNERALQEGFALQALPGGIVFVPSSAPCRPRRATICCAGASRFRKR